MNKQELQKQANRLPSTLLDKRVLVDKSAILGLIDQLDEPQKVVIPRFVAEWIDKCKSEEECLSFAIGNHISHDVSNWLAFNDCHNEEVFAEAWLYGYEVEQEKLYTVEIPDPNNHSWKNTILYKANNKSDRVRIGFTDRSDWRRDNDNQLTEAEIKQDFEWAWNAGFAKEITDGTEI